MHPLEGVKKRPKCIHLSMLEEAVVALPVEDDDVVEQRDPQGFPCGLEGFRYLPVFSARREIACRMVVGDDDRRRPVRDRIGEHLAGMDMRPFLCGPLRHGAGLFTHG